MNKPVIAVVFGTRPEAIKMVSVIQILKKQDQLNTVIISTGQHRQMLDQILTRFNISVDFEMDLMEPNQTLYRLTSKAVVSFENIFLNVKPSMLLVQGDTTTAFLGALCAFYSKIPVGHVEAGLRTDQKYFPFPEEINRRLITQCADLNFAPTEGNRSNLLRESIPQNRIFVTGNTVIDTLKLTVQQPHPFPLKNISLKQKRLILVTVHRRESFGEPLVNIFNAIKKITRLYSDVEIVYPVHLNPNVQKPAHEILGNIPNVHLIDPLDYFDFVKVMESAYLILTDSGGVQEEAPSLGVPIIVLRNETERPEAVQAGTVKLAGTSEESILNESRKILDSEIEHEKLKQAKNPYGDGMASNRIVYQILKYFGLQHGTETVETEFI